MSARLATLWREHRVTVVVLVLLAVGYLSLRSSPTDVASAESFLDSVRDGSPSIVVFYSNT